MAEYLHPGVYIEEIERGPRPIEGVATSTAAFLGETERGPLWPTPVTSYSQYRRLFGENFAPDKFMPQALSGFFDNGGRRVYVARVVAQNVDTATFASGGLTVDAVGPGEWGGRIFVHTEESTTKIPDPQNAGQSIPLGFLIRIAYWRKTPPNGLFDPFTAAGLTTLPRPDVIETFDDLALDEVSPNYWDKRLNGRSNLVEIDIASGTAVSALTGITGALAQQNPAADPAPAVGDFTGVNAPPGSPVGLEALKLDEFRDIALVYAPGMTQQNNLAVLKAVISHCEGERFRFAVIDAPPDSGQPNTLDPRTNIQDTSFAAFYYPWIEIADPATGQLRSVPPGGHVLGVYARTDVNRGVFKAPANEPLNGVIDLEFNVNDAIQDVLNPLGIDAIRKFPGRGIQVWGARTLSSNTLWKYVNVRRLFIFLEHSIYDGTQWVVFEPNDERLWARVKDTIRLFLRTQWRNGALMGETEDQAFQIACDRSTTTQDDILNGRLICEIGIAPVRPAEFVVFRIFQNTAEAQT
jgi:phage tail sheath protein FI